MSAPELHGLETAEELTWLGFAFAHVALYREHERLARIRRRNQEGYLRWCAHLGVRP